MVSLNSLIRLAKKSPYKNWQHAAIVFRGGAVVGFATNTKNLHAEVRAINKVVNKTNLTLVSVRVNKEGQLRLAYPCYECLQYMEQHGVRQFWYTTESGSLERNSIIQSDA